MIRMKLGDLINIKLLEFDIANRNLMVFHEGGYDEILKSLESLDFGTSFIESVSLESELLVESHSKERKLLWQVLVINFFFFFTELLFGFVSSSIGLIADSLDMLADSIVYGLALFAVGGVVTRKKNVARVSGYFQLILAFFGFVEVIRRFFLSESLPVFQVMVTVSVLALIGNVACLYLLQRSRSNEAHMQASMIFTSNDVIVNLGVILAGFLVYLTDSKYPDLIVGIVVFYLVWRGAFKILELSK